MKLLIIVVVTVLVTVIVLGGAGAVYQAKIKGANQEATVVRLEKPVMGTLVETINAPGEVEPKRSVDISAKISARIVELPYEEGEVVTKGEPEAKPPSPSSVLVRLDDTDMQAQLRTEEARRAAQAAQIEVAKVDVETRKAQIKSSQALLREARLNLERQKTLLETKDVSQSEVDSTQARVDDLTARLAMAENEVRTAELQLEVMRHNLAAADAQIARARDMLEHTTIRSPIDGTITRINAEEGEMVMTGTMNNPGTVIMVVSDLSKMLLQTEVDEADVGLVNRGDEATVHIHAWPEMDFKGEVETIALSHDMNRTGSKYYRTEIMLELQEGYPLLSGMTGDVDIRVKEHEGVMLVPSQAVMARKVDELPVVMRDENPLVDKKKTYVTVVYRFVDGKAVVTPVKMGKSDAMQTIIEEGLTVEDKVIVGPFKELEKLKHEQKVRDEKSQESVKGEKASRKVN